LPLKVYYIDDEELLCEMFSELFSSDDISIFTFSDPKDAIEAARLDPPGICFIDFRLPSMTGDFVASRMDASIPKYLVTGDLSVNTSYQFIQTLYKPIETKRVLEILEDHKRQ
jgi:FixJ family two-component response regulator